VLTDAAALKLIRWYCREAGVRNLQKHTDKICRKVALKVVKGGDSLKLPVCIDEDNLEEYVGKPPWFTDRIYADHTPPGVVMGLAWTSMGGSVLYVETVDLTVPEPPQRASDEQPDGEAGGRERPRVGTASLITTGKLGEVMLESSKLAHTLARRHLRVIDPSNTFLDRATLHMHVPEGATPKDGPSAGVTMVTSLLSLALNKPVRENVAMTGEVSLTGLVLPIGGVKEKVIAAQRAGVKHIILPRSNQRDFAELPDNLRAGLDAHFVSTYDDVYKVAFSES
jgi:Lon-like ATP-dependent protease